MLSTLDNLCNGRLICTVAPGWMKEEFDILGVPYEGRIPKTEEFIKILKNLWSENPDPFEGEFYTFKNVSFQPKPLQDKLQIWMGGNADGAIQRAVEYADGWQPIWFSPEELQNKGFPSSVGSFSELLGSYGITKDTRNRAFMPTSGSIVSFNQSLPIFADKQAISNTFKATKYKSITDDVVGAGKIYLSAINGIGDDDVRISKRKGLSTRRLRGFERNKIGPVDGSDHIGGNYVAAVNFEANLPNLLPESYRTDVGLFLSIRLLEKRILRAPAKKMFIWELFH